MDSPVLVTGATGYVGGRLVPLLLERGHRVRAVGRSAAKIRCRPWSGNERLEIAEADLHDPTSLKSVCEGCDTAFYLIHSMAPRHGDFAQADRAAAYNMVDAARESGLGRIIYLSGLGAFGDETLSEHLHSRAEVGRILSLAPARLTMLRAAMILGAGSASFEILRYLAEHLPVMTTPRWVRTRSQPIAISNVLTYLAGCLEQDSTAGRTFDIGGPDILSYEDLFRIYAEEAGLRKRLIIPLPLLSPRLSSHWLRLVTPVPLSLARPLVEGLRNEAVCREHAIRELVPQELLSCREAVRRAMERVRQQAVDTCWHDAGQTPPPEWVACGDPAHAGGTVLQDGYRTTLAGTPQDIWPAVARLGGETGWYRGDRLWRLRGLVDKLVGGPGLRRGRRHPEELREGDAVDFWRVVRVDPGEALVLHAEMRLPGEAMLELRLDPAGEGGTTVSLVPRLLPRGLAGLAYWYSVLPLHGHVFKGMLAGIAEATGREILSPPEAFQPVPKQVCKFAARNRSG